MWVVQCLIFFVIFSLNHLDKVYANLPGPLAGHWCLPNPSPNSCSEPSLLDWKPDDFISNFYRSTTPLAPTFILDIQRNSDAQIIPFVGYLRFDTTQTPAQMIVGMNNVPHIRQWQYLKTHTYFGGSYDEGQVLAPSPGWIKAAHQNGVRILGSIFFSPYVYGGNEEGPALDLFLTPLADGSYPVADKLIEIAKTYNFDGYFLNQETDTSTSVGSPNSRFAAFFDYYHKKAKQENVDLSLVWYQVPASPLYTNAVNLLRDLNGTRIADSLFLDYSWYGNDPSEFFKLADAVKYSHDRLDFGINAYDSPSGDEQIKFFKNLIGDNDLLKASVSEFSFDSIMIRPGDTRIEQQLSNEVAFWEGAASKNSWPGAAKFVSKHGVVSKLPFSTWFNIGQGYAYYIDGIDTNLGIWNDIGQQDLLPTFSSQTDQLVASYDFYDAYYGSSSLSISARNLTGSDARLDLYATKIDVEEDIVLLVTSKSLDSSDLQVSLCLVRKGDEDCYPLSTESGGWNQDLFTVKSGAGVDGIRMYMRTSDSKKESYNHTFKIGQIFLGHKETLHPPSAPQNVREVGPKLGDANRYIAWDAVQGVSHYEIYEGDDFIGRTNQSIYALIGMGRNHILDIQVCAVNAAGLRSSKIRFTKSATQILEAL